MNNIKMVLSRTTLVLTVGMLIVGYVYNVPSARAQMMGGQMMGRQTVGQFSNTTADWEKVVAHTTQEEKEGKEVWDKLQSKQIQCNDLTDDNFETLGEYFMGQMMGASHASMNAMMIQMHGEEGEKQIHNAMGKRFSGCDTATSTIGVGGGWMPMMHMMGNRGSYSPYYSGFNNHRNPMMYYSGSGMMGWGMGGYGWIFTILFWILIIIAFLALMKWFRSSHQLTGLNNDRTSLDILKERYAKGEIDKDEFDTKRKDLKV